MHSSNVHCMNIKCCLFNLILLYFFLRKSYLCIIPTSLYIFQHCTCSFSHKNPPMAHHMYQNQCNEKCRVLQSKLVLIPVHTHKRNAFNISVHLIALCCSSVFFGGLLIFASFVTIIISNVGIHRRHRMNERIPIFVCAISVL